MLELRAETFRTLCGPGVNKNIKIWLVNPVPRPMDVPSGQVVALAEWVHKAEGPTLRHNSASVSDIDRMVWQASKHLTDDEGRELEEALRMRQQLFVTSKGDFVRTSIVKHNINTILQP